MHDTAREEAKPEGSMGLWGVFTRWIDSWGVADREEEDRCLLANTLRATCGEKDDLDRRRSGAGTIRVPVNELTEVPPMEKDAKVL